MNENQNQNGITKKSFKGKPPFQQGFDEETQVPREEPWERFATVKTKPKGNWQAGLRFYDNRPGPGFRPR